MVFFTPLHSQPRLTLNLDADTPLAGNVAVSVVDANVVKPDSTGDNIVSALLASSELRGKVERPLDYFKGDNKSRQDMDLLMLTQGWRRYPMTDIIEGKTTAPSDSFETSQSISGRVKSTIGSTKDVTLEMLVPKTMERKKFKVGKRFVIDDLDFVDRTTFVLQAVGKRYQSRTLQLYIDDLKFPLTNGMENFTREPAKDIPNGFYSQSHGALRFNSIMNAYELPEVNISARKFKQWNTKGIDDVKGFAEDDPVFEKSLTMTQLIARLNLGISVGEVGEPGYDAPTKLIEDPDFAEYAGFQVFRKQIFTGNIIRKMHFVPIVVFVDDMIVNDPAGLQEVVNMDPLNVKHLEASRDGQVLFIYTKNGNEPSRFRLFKPLSVATVQQLGYKPPVEFYVPKFMPEEHRLNMDRRTTLYWNPSIRLGNGAKLDFTPSDISKSYMVTLEGVADDGTVIHEQKIMK